MTTHSLPDYDDLANVLTLTTLKLHPSQAHGMVCGLLCGSSTIYTAAWEELMTGGPHSEKTRELLQRLFEASAYELSEFIIEFQLILPNDDDELSERAEALTLWCQGFLTGLKLVNIPIVNREPNDLTEAINDLIEIAKMNYENVMTTEEDEAAYIELVEYVRMAVIFIYQEEQKTIVNTIEPESKRV